MNTEQAEVEKSKKEQISAGNKRYKEAGAEGTNIGRHIQAKQDGAGLNR